MPALNAVRSINASSKPSFSNVPTAVVLGGTSGIGQAIAFKLANYIKPIHIIISGRSKESAEQTINELKKINEDKDSSFEFVSCDVTLLKNMHQYTQEIKKKLDKLNYLVITAGFFSLSGRTETEEGIDRSMAAHYYSRFLVINELLPLLQKAKIQGEEARVLTVLSAGNGGKVDEEDLDLKKGFSFMAAFNHTITFNDLMVEELSLRNPEIAFIHAYPGAVKTPIYSTRLAWYWRPFAKLFGFLLKSPNECGEFMVNGLLAKDFQKGWYMLGQYADALPRNKYATESLRKKLWDHSVALVGEKQSEQITTTNL